MTDQTHAEPEEQPTRDGGSQTDTKPFVGAVGPVRAPEEEEASPLVSRRDVLNGVASGAAVGALMYLTPRRTAAQSSPSGVFPESGDDPLLELRADRYRVIPRTSDPSNRPVGLHWVNTEA